MEDVRRRERRHVADLSEPPVRTGADSAGALTPTLALASLAEVEFRMGDWAAAYASAVEALRLAYRGGRGEETVRALAQLALIEAGLGREPACRAHGEQALALAAPQASNACAARAREALGLLELGLGRLDAAIRWLEPLVDAPGRAGDAGEADLVEALIRRGEHARAAEALARAAARADCCWSRRALERCRGLLAPDHEFETHFERALDGPAAPGDPFGSARTELCLAQRLRGARRPRPARRRLRSALASFERLGAAHWAESARRELEAGGERVARPPGALDELTAREHEVALHVSEGATNREAAAALFLTVKTIEAHLRSIYRKLSVRSRAELTRLVLSSEQPPRAPWPVPAAGQSSGFSSMRRGDARTRIAS